MMVNPEQKLRLPVQQLIILSICRFAEPVALTSVFPYLPEMIESFNVPENDVAKWAGITSAIFSFSQCLTGLAWGRASDYFGRKYTILAGLTCTMCASLLFGFSQNLAWAVVARSLAGASSGTVGIIRTTVAELVPERELQPKAFSIMPLVWSVGAIVGPILGGELANPAKHLPDIFGGIHFFEAFPFALPNIVASVMFVIGVSSGFLFLKETLEHRKNERDYGRILGRALIGCSTSRLRRSNRRKEYDSRSLRSEAGVKRSPVSPPSYREVFSYQSSLNLFTYTLLALHSIAYDQLIAVFLHTTFDMNRDYNTSSFLKFSGGFGLTTARIGLLLTLYGVVAMFLQFLVFPPMARKYGILNCLRAVTLLYPFIYAITPFAVLLPTDTARQVAIFGVMLFKCFAGVFSFPCTTILLTNSAGSLRLLGTLNGVATSISAAGRGIGPFTSGNLFTWGMKIGYVVIPWWFLAFFGVLGHIPTWWLVESEGFGSKDDNEENSDDEDDEEDPSMELPLSGTVSEHHQNDMPTDTQESQNLLQRTTTFESIVEESESDDDDADHRPLLANVRTNSQTRSASKNLTAGTGRYPRRSPTRSGSEASVIQDEEDQTSAPLGMGQIVRKGRRLSSNLGFSEGLGRTESGSGFGTRGPDLGMGYDSSRSRSASKRRDASRSLSRSKTTKAGSSGQQART